VRVLGNPAVLQRGDTVGQLDDGGEHDRVRAHGDAGGDRAAAGA
jgi:hypothetical protein